jgi:phage terminase large subunit-like protein
VVKHRPKKKQPPKKRSDRAVEWFEDYLHIPEGRFVGEPLKVAEFMKEDLRAIYDNPAGTRRAIISRGRKNGKTIEAAMIVLLHLCGPEYKRNSQIYSTALSRDQAALLFHLAVKMIRASPELNAAVTVREAAKSLSCPQLGTTYRALSAEATTAFGLSPALVIL